MSIYPISGGVSEGVDENYSTKNMFTFHESQTGSWLASPSVPNN